MDELTGLAPEMALEPLPVTPPQPVKQKPQDWKQAAPLLALLPLAMRQGPDAAAALISGWQRSQMSRQQTAQEQAQKDFENRRLVAGDEATAAYRRQTLGAQAAQRQATLLKQFQEALGGVKSPEEVNALLDLYGGQMPGQAERLSNYALQTVTPTELQRRQADKAWKDITATYPMEWLAEQEANPQGTKFTVGGEKLPISEIRRRAMPVGIGPDGQVVPMPRKAATDRRGFTTKNVTVNGKGPILAGYDPDTNTYYAPGDTKTPLTGTIQEYQDPKSGGGAGRELTPTARANVVGSRRNQWQRFTKSIMDRQTSVAKIDAGVKALERGNRNAATQIIIFAFNKLQDEASVVREGEYARSEQLVPLINRIEGAIQRIAVGGANMKDEDLRALAFEAKQIAQSMDVVTQEAAANLRQGIEEELADYGIPPTRVFGNSTIGKRAGTAPAAPPAQAAPSTAPSAAPRIYYDMNGRPVKH